MQGQQHMSMENIDQKLTPSISHQAKRFTQSITGNVEFLNNVFKLANK